MKIKHFFATSLLLATVSTSVLATTHSFEDLENHWGAPYIEDAVNRGFFAGRSETEFDPDASITRAEFAIVMLKVAGFDAPDTETEGPWYTKYYEAAASNYILPNTFTLENLGEPITREEMAATMILTVGPHLFSHLEGNTPDLNDLDTVDDNYLDFVTVAVAAGLMAGMDGGFNPQGTATRAMAATVSTALADGYFSEDALPELAPFDSKLHEAYAAIINTARDPEEIMSMPLTSSTTDPMWQFIQGSLSLSADDLEAFSIGTSMMNIKAYCVAILKPAEGSEETVLNGLKAFQESKIQEFTYYLQDQLVYAQNPVLEILEDGTILFVMSETAEETAATILLSLTDFDLDTFEFPEIDHGTGGMLPDMGDYPEDMLPDMGFGGMGGLLPDDFDEDGHIPDMGMGGFGGLLTPDMEDMEHPDDMLPNMGV